MADWDIISSINGGMNAIGADSKKMPKETKLTVHIGVPVATLKYGSDARNWQGKNKSRLNTVEMIPEAYV